MLKEDRQVIHLEIKETGEHHYFGSVSALFAVYEDLMGIKFQTFRAKAKDTFTETTPFALLRLRTFALENLPPFT